MNICFFNCIERTGTATVGGIGRAAHLLAEELRRRGHRVDFYASSSFLHPSSKNPFFSACFRSFPTSFLFPPLYNRYEGEYFRKFLKEHKIDVAVWHEKPGGFPFSLKNLPCKLITLFHSTPAYVFPQDCADYVIKKLKIGSRLGIWLVRSKPSRYLLRKYYTFLHNYSLSYAVRHSNKFVLLSESFIPGFAPAKKFPQKVCAIPNIAPFDAQNVSTNEKKKELLWLGRMDFGKRPDHMLQIWQRLQDRFPDWSLRFVGDGPYLSELKTLAKELGAQRVFFDGYQDPTPYYRSAPIFCMTSAYEGFGLVLVEAQAYGCVPVAFESLGPFRDIIDDGVNGVLVQPFDLDAYAEKLAELMTDSELRERLARNGQKSIAKFSDKTIGDAWGKLLEGGGSRKEKELLWLARVEFEQKRPDYMLEVWQKLQDRFPDWSLRFVGDGGYLQELKALAKELGVKNVSFEGYQNPIPYYRSASIFCMTSTFEGFGLTLVEAQAFSCVPIAFESYSAAHDIIEDGVNGFLVPPFDLDTYAEKLAGLMTNSELRERLARNGQESVAKFSAEAVGDKWERLFREIGC